MIRSLLHSTKIFSLLSIAALLLLCSCGSRTYTAPMTAVDPPLPGGQAKLVASFTSLQQNIFQPKCVTCHSGPNANKGVFLDSLANVQKVVVGGNAGASLLFQQVTSGRMPWGGPPLSSVEISAIENWINGGAKN